MFIRDRFMRAGTKESTDYLDIYTFTKGESAYKVAVIKKYATKRVNVRCSDNRVEWERRYPHGISPAVEVTIITQTQNLLDADHQAFLVIKGHPNRIEGLDEGAFVCASRWSREVSRDKLFVMTERAFRRIKKKF